VNIKRGRKENQSNQRFLLRFGRNWEVLTVNHLAFIEIIKTVGVQFEKKVVPLQRLNRKLSNRK
jgi:hypothetical protein